MRVDFKKPFELDIASFKEFAEYIEIPAPTGSVSGYIGELEQQIGFAFANSMKLAEGVSEEKIKEASEKKEEEEIDPETEAKTILTQLTMGNADMGKCYDVLKKCISKGKNKAMINGELAVTEGVFEMLPHTEIRRVLGYFIVNFTNILD